LCRESHRLTYADLSLMNKVGASFENAMTGAFTWWGTKAALYPLPVIVLSIGFAAGLSSGNELPVAANPEHSLLRSLKGTGSRVGF
jgi:hypothetical protein